MHSFKINPGIAGLTIRNTYSILRFFFLFKVGQSIPFKASMCETLGLSAGEKTQRKKKTFFFLYKHVLEKPLRRREA